MVRMKVVDANGESAMDEVQWEAASEIFRFMSPNDAIAYEGCQTFILGSHLRSGEVTVVDSLVDTSDGLLVWY